MIPSAPPESRPRRMRDVVVYQTAYVVRRGEEPFYEIVVGPRDTAEDWRVPIITRDNALWSLAMAAELDRRAITIELAPLAFPHHLGEPVRYYLSRIL